MSRLLLKKSIIYIFEMCLTITTHSLLIASSVCYEQSSHSLGFNGTITTAILDLCVLQRLSLPTFFISNRHCWFSLPSNVIIFFLNPNIRQQHSMNWLLLFGYRRTILMIIITIFRQFFIIIFSSWYHAVDKLFY